MSYPKGIIDRAFNKAPGEAVSYLEGKVAKASFNWYDLNESAHNKAFTVSKMASADALEATKLALENSLKNGETFEKFQKNIRGTLSRSGWLNSDERDRIIAPYRLKNIYRTNIQQAYNAGRESRIQRHNKTNPFSQYIAVMDSVTRPSHSALNGLVIANNDEFWFSFSPSNGYGCRCRRRGLSQRKIDRKGLKVSSFNNEIGSKEVFINKSKGIKTNVAQTTVNGKKVSPDAGFSSSPLSKFVPDLSKYPNPTKTELKKVIKTAPKVAKRKTSSELSRVAAKKQIKASEKPKNLNETFSQSEKDLKQWSDKIEPIRDLRAEGDSVFIDSTGQELRRLEPEFVKKIKNINKLKTFREQAFEVNKLRKNFRENSTGITAIQRRLASSVKKASKEGLDQSIKPFKDLSIGTKIRVKNDLFKAGENQKSIIKQFSKIENIDDQIKFLSKNKESISYELNSAIKSAIEYQQKETLLFKSNFLGANSFKTDLPDSFAPTKIPVTFKSIPKKDRPEFNRRIKAAEKFYKGNVSSEMIPEESVLSLVGVKRKKDGSFYRRSEGLIEYNFIQNEDTIVHEFGHHIHDNNDRVGNVISEFYRKRTAGDKVTISLKYKNTEFLRDQFGDDYIGKIYNVQRGGYIKKDITLDYDKYEKNQPHFQLGTEVFTRGIQKYFFDREYFYAEDPQFFELISAILKGNIPK